jgi:cytochrome o ubiquinol oxidase operon protein cyoD
MENHSSMPVLPEGAQHSTLKSYLIGFGLSLVFTLAAYFLVSEHLLNGWALGASIGVLALLQAAVQLLYFLHLGKEGKPHWNTLVFVFMFLVLLIIILGSLWIMYSLDYRVMDTMDMDALMKRNL